jgi:hypothetical protein
MNKIIFALVMAGSIFMLSSCTDEPTARKVLLNAGLHDIQMTGYKAFACSEDDIFHTGFSAVNRDGNVVTGVVCQGVFKGSTIRYF